MTTLTADQTQRSGFWNLLARENKVWWKGRRWLLQTLFGAVGLGGFLAFAILIVPRMAEATGETLEPLSAGTQVLFGMGAFLFAIDIIILTQDAIIGEKRSGISEWVLSKPVSRPAYLLAKFVANTVGMLVTLILIPGAVAYVLFQAAGTPIPAASFAAAKAVLALHTLFYLALSLMMGVIADSPSMLLAVTLGSLLGGAALVNFAGPIAFVTPWPSGSIAIAVAQNAPLPPVAWLPVASTALLTAVAITVAIWRFGKTEL